MIEFSAALQNGRKIQISLQLPDRDLTWRVASTIHWTLPSILFLFWISVRQAAHRQSLLFSMHFDMLSCQANFEYVMSIAIDSFRH